MSAELVEFYGSLAARVHMLRQSLVKGKYQPVDCIQVGLLQDLSTPITGVIENRKEALLLALLSRL